jgi:hypothetical protein
MIVLRIPMMVSSSSLSAPKAAGWPVMIVK